MQNTAQLDHLVVLAATLEEGVAWCEASLGIRPDAGGRHLFMGTHNRLLRTSSSAFAHSYLEIIAIDPEGSPPAAPKQRWFDMDDATLQAQVRAQGPQLVHWVARVPDIAQATQTLQQLGLAVGTPQAASRPTPRGLLEWQIGLRDDGVRPLAGCLPTLIHWSGPHPEASLTDPGIALLQLELAHPQGDLLQTALQALGLPLAHIRVRTAPVPSLSAQLATPRGTVCLNVPLPR